MSRNLEQTNDDKDVRVKKPRRFGQEQKRGGQNERSDHLKENNTTSEGLRFSSTKRETPSSETRERTHLSRTDSESQHDDHQRKHTEVKRRQGPIKPPKQPSQEEVGSEKGASGADDSGHCKSSQDAAGKAGRGSGRHTPLQGRGGRRTNHQNHKSGQRSWDRMPKSKETQTG